MKILLDYCEEKYLQRDENLAYFAKYSFQYRDGKLYNVSHCLSSQLQVSFFLNEC